MQGVLPHVVRLCGVNKVSHEDIDTDNVVQYLNHAFEKTLQRVQPKLDPKESKPQRYNEPAGRVPNGNLVYRYQVEFTHLIDEIQRGPQYIVPKVISDANELIRQLEREGTKK